MIKLHLATNNQELQTAYTTRQNHSDDSGVDLYSPQTIIVPPNSQAKIDFQINCEMLNGLDYCGYLLVPRSSIVKTPLRMSNSIGIIDKNYRGNIMAFVDNISDQEFAIEKMGRYFQIVHPSLSPLQLELVQFNQLSTTERGAGGFGSTGK